MKKIILMLVVLVFMISANAAYIITPDGVRFTIKDNGYDTVHIAGTFNVWSSTRDQLTRNDGIWQIELPLKPGKYQYKFIIDSKDWILDPDNSVKVKDGEFENSYMEFLKDDIPDQPPEPQVQETDPVIERENLLKKRMTHFKYVDKNVESVSVVGDFNKWDRHAFKLSDTDGDGVWEGDFYIEPGKYSYMFVVNGVKWYSDPEASEYVDDGFGGKNSVITVEGQR